MRTTVNIDSDVETLIKSHLQAVGGSFKETLNEALRIGIPFMAKKIEAKPYKTKAQSMGLYAHLNYDNIGELLEEAESHSSQWKFWTPIY